jgi:hypothetical protein
MSISIIFCIGRIIWTFLHYHRNEINHVPIGQQQLHRRYCQILTSPTVGHIFVLFFLLIFQVKFIFKKTKEILINNNSLYLDTFSLLFGTYF